MASPRPWGSMTARRNFDHQGGRKQRDLLFPRAISFDVRAPSTSRLKRRPHQTGTWRRGPRFRLTPQTSSPQYVTGSTASSTPQNQRRPQPCTRGTPTFHSSPRAVVEPTDFRSSCSSTTNQPVLMRCRDVRRTPGSPVRSPGELGLDPSFRPLPQPRLGPSPQFFPLRGGQPFGPHTPRFQPIE